jgi:hypothetical protein
VDRHEANRSNRGTWRAAEHARGAATAAPALAGTGTRQLHLAAISSNFTSFTCLNALCSLGEATVVAKASSNLSTGTGSYQADLIVDFLGQSAPGGSCNIVDEHTVFAFGNGTILIHSHHEDCALHGLRIDTTFDVTGGTGAFADASGGGREFSAAANPAAVIYNGTITF